MLHIVAISARLIRAFRRKEDGAVTVDYTVGIAAGVTLALAVMNSVGNATKSFADEVSLQIISGSEITY